MKKITVRFSSLNATVIRLGLVSLFADISSEMLYPITPLFLTMVLGSSMFSVGLIEGVAEAIASLLKAYSGYWSDRLQKRKVFIWVGYLLTSLAKPITGMATSWTHVLFARGLDRTGKGLRTGPRDALLSESVSEKNRGAAFGWHRAMDTIGAAIGPLLAFGFLSKNAANLRPLYFWAFLPGLASVALVFTVREKKVLPLEKSEIQKQNWNWQALDGKFKTYLVGWGIFSLANSSDVFLLLKAKHSGISIQNTLLLYCFYNLTYALMSPYFGKLSDQLGRGRVLGGGLLVFAMVYLGFSFATASFHFWILFGIYGIYMAATDGVGKALAIDLVPPRFKATGVGVLGMVTGIATIIASSTAGLLWDQMGASVPFLYGAVGALLAAFIIAGGGFFGKNSLR